MIKKKLILASKSPRRKEILEKCGIPFACMPMEMDETLDDSLSLEERIRDLSIRKAKARLELNPDAVILGSDTIVTVDDEILGKPKDREDACRMLRMLSGRTHRVITGVCIISSEKMYSDVSVSEVTFAEMSDEEITAYASTGECDDKAGAYAIQGYAARFISRISGDYYAIMGLPLHMVYTGLKDFGFL